MNILNFRDVKFIWGKVEHEDIVILPFCLHITTHGLGFTFWKATYQFLDFKYKPFKAWKIERDFEKKVERGEL